MVRGVRDASNQAGRDGPIDEADDAVVTDHQVLRDLTESRSHRVVVATNREEELMLGWGQTRGSSSLLAPLHEAAEAHAKREQLIVGDGRVGHIVARYYRVVSQLSHPRRIALMSICAVVLGVASGLAGFLLLKLIGLMTNLFLFHRLGVDIPSFGQLRAGPGVVAAAVVGGLAVSILARWSPAIRGHGIPEAMEVVLTRQSRIAPSTAVAKPLSAAIAIGTGGPFGAEGPIIVTGGALGSLLGQVLEVSPAERKILLAAGAAAGMAATFGAPLASVLLAFELLLFEFSTRAFVPLAIAASIAAGIHAWLLGPGPLFAVPPHDFTGLKTLPLFAILGIACGGLAIVVSRGLFLVEAGFRRLPVNEIWHPVVGAGVFATVGLLEPRALGVGYDAISDVLAGRLVIGALLTLLAVKLVTWWVALGSGTSGGTLAPVLLISGSFGAVIGKLLSLSFPGLHVDPGAFALVAMAATFGAATRATFTSIVFLFELTRDYGIVLPLLVAAVLADLVAAFLVRESLMTEKLARRGLRVTAEYEVNPFRQVRVASVMSRQVETLPVETTVGAARARFAIGRHGAYPIIDEHGVLCGIVSRTDLLGNPTASSDGPVLSIASRQVVSVATEDNLLTALDRMLSEDVEHLPVLDHGRLVGICTRSDVLQARREQLEAETLQPGWKLAPRSQVRAAVGRSGD